MSTKSLELKSLEYRKKILEIIFNGGRVLNITASGDNLKEAINSAYKIIDMLDSSNLQYRKDIGAKGLLKNS